MKSPVSRMSRSGVQRSIVSAMGCALLALCASGAERAWTGASGVDNYWSTAANWSGNAVPGSGDVAVFDSASPGGGASVTTVAVTDTRTVQQIWVTNRTADVVLTIAAGQRLSVSNSGGKGIQAYHANLTFNGDGQLGLSSSSDSNQLDNGANPGFTLAINVPIVATDGTQAVGFESWVADSGKGGTVVLGCETNAFTRNVYAGNGHTIIASKLADSGQPSSIGAGTGFLPARGSILRYTGPAVTTDRLFLPNSGDANLGYGGGIEQAGSGTLTWAGNVYNNANATQTFQLSGESSSPDGYVTGNIYNSTGTLGVRKGGSGTWVLAGSNSFTGGLTINGGTLGLGSTNAAGNVSQITMANGAALAVNPAGAAGFTATFPRIVASGDIALSAGANTTVTFGGLTVPVLTVTAVAVTADPSARIFITGFPVGIAGPWLTLNGGPARYDLATGLTPAAGLTTQSLATRGNALPNGAAVAAVIDAPGTGADIWLTADPTTLFTLTQAEPTDTATVALNGATLMAAEVGIAAGADALTVGAAPKDGLLLPQGLVLPPAPPAEAAIAALGPVIWYDPSDASTVSLNASGLVTNLVNKGLFGATHDAIVRPVAGHTGPFYATGANSHAALPMLRSTASDQGLWSAANTGITGNTPRTLIAVQSRNPGLNCIVSIGSASSGKAFETFLRNDNTRFGTYSGDIDMATSPAETPVVMAFQNGVDGDNGKFQSWADGVASATRTRTDLNTDNTPLSLMYRNGGTDAAYRGQIGEVLLFTNTLTTAERQTVEAYLLAKWKSGGAKAVGAAPAQNGTLALRNDSAATLTVNAAVIAPYDTAVLLSKFGTGNVTLAGGARLPGTVLIEQGTLTFDTPPGQMDTPSGVISGAGKLVKDGPGGLLLPSGTANAYTGGTDILGGTARIGNSRSLGTGPVSIAPGATLDIGGGTAADALRLNNRVTLSGAGPGGEGALVNNGPFQQRYAFENTTVTLAGPTAIGGSFTGRWDFAANVTTTPSLATLDLNGHTLTKKGPSLFRLSPATVTNAPAGLAFDIQQGTLGIEYASPLLPDLSDREIAIHTGACFGIYQTATPLNWKIVPDDGAEIQSYGGNELTNQNVLATAITLPPGTLNLTATGTFNKMLTGKLTGPGGLRVSGGGTRAMSLLANPANDFTGPVTVNNAVLGLRYLTSLPDLAKLTLEASGCVRLFMGNPGEWPSANAAQLANRAGLFNANTQCLQIQVVPGATATLTDPIGSAPAPFIGRLDKYGCGTLVIDANITFGASTGSPRIHNGTVILTGTAVWNASRATLCLPDPVVNDDTGYTNATLIVRGNAQYLADDVGYNTSLPTTRPGHTAGKGIVELSDNAFIRSGIRIGGSESGDTGGIGAVYQSGNSHWLSTSGGGQDGRIGSSGYGYWQLDGGRVTFKGYTTLGWWNNATSVGILRQTAGHILFNGSRTGTPGNGNTGDTQDAYGSYGGMMDLSRGGVGILHLEGGTFLHYGNMKILSQDNGGTSDGNNGTGTLTVSGTADATFDRQIEMGHRANGTATINLNGGKLTATYIYRRLRTTSTAAVNFNGGTLCVTNNSGNQYLFAVETPADYVTAGRNPIFLNVFGGGANIELGQGVTRIIDRPLVWPAVFGVAAIPVTAGGTGYIAPPHVAISGGGGTNATAIARIDRATGALTGIEITSPGWGYTNAPTVTLTGGGGSGATFGTALLISNAESKGGLTKTGPGTLVLDAPCTYRGPTRVDGGTLTLRHPQAIHPASEIIIGDGTLDLGGNTITNASVTVSGTGRITNGKVVTASAVKTGPGTAAWDAEIEFAAVGIGGIPGLWEGHRQTTPPIPYWDIYYPNPKESIQITTRAGNIAYGNNTTGDATRNYFWGGCSNLWIYTGYLWNRTGTNETWTWRGRWDDNVRLVIDTNQVLSCGSTATYANYTLTPGPHPIEIRFGDGSGSVGANESGQGGLTYDRLGRNTTTLANYIRLQDDGLGTLLTVNSGETEQKHDAIQVQDGTLLLPSAQPSATISVADGATLDLGGQTHPGLTVTGNGTVVNGVSGSGATLSPAGGDRTGTLSVDGTVLNGATYRLTVHDAPIPAVTPTNTPGLWEGRRQTTSASWDINFPNPKTAVRLTTRAGNVPFGTNSTTPRSEFWGGNYNMWIYTGYIWNRTGTNENWTWRTRWDDNVSLKIDNYQLINSGSTATYINYTLTPGAHPIEVRFGDNTGSVGANDTPLLASLSGVLFDRYGRYVQSTDSTVLTANYQRLEDDGTGALLTLEGEFPTPPPGDDGICDVITSTGLLDLTGLIITPSDLLSVSPTGNDYVIARATGGFTGTLPTLRDFEGKVWKLRRNGNELLLTTKGGTILILR